LKSDAHIGTRPEINSKSNTKTKRPTAVRVATVVAGLSFLSAIFMVRYFLLAPPGDRALYFGSFKDPFYASRMTASLLCFPALIFKPRALFTFYATATFLALMIVAFLGGLISGPGIGSPLNPVSARAAGALLTLLTGWLFWRFCFGQPSREFFRFAAEAADPAKDAAS
jgi:hypothetical protein